MHRFLWARFCGLGSPTPGDTANFSHLSRSAAGGGLGDSGRNHMKSALARGEVRKQHKPRL